MQEALEFIDSLAPIAVEILFFFSLKKEKIVTNSGKKLQKKAEKGIDLFAF